MNGNDLFSPRELKLLAISALLAAFGGVAKLCLARKPLTFYRFLTQSIISGFTGVMASYLTRYLDLPPQLQYFLIGMAGFVAPTALSAFTIIFERKLGVKLDQTRTQPPARNKPEGKR